jgi:hypothetical protein
MINLEKLQDCIWVDNKFGETARLCTRVDDEFGETARLYIWLDDKVGGGFGEHVLNEYGKAL